MRIDHAALFCRDLEQMRQFFIDYFDARSNEQYHNPRTGLRTYILSFTEGSRKGVDLLTRRLAADGYTVTSGPRTTGDGYYESSILGPEGIQIELTE